MKRDPRLENAYTAQEKKKEQFIKLPKYLMGNTPYAKMSKDAKFLFAYLLDKLDEFEWRKTKYEKGEYGRSYVDENGLLYVVAPNIELEIFLGVTENTVIKYKKELESYGLLFQEEIKDQPNRMYVLKPSDIDLEWNYQKDFREEVQRRQKEAKAKRDEKRKIAAEKRKAERQKKAAEKAEQTRMNNGDLKNCGHGDLKNCGHVTSKIAASNKNLETKELKELQELINISFSLEEIAAQENELKNQFPGVDFETIKKNVLNDGKLGIVSIPRESNYFGLLKSRLENATKPKAKRQYSAKTTRSEMVPDWFEEKDKHREQEQQQQQDRTPEEIEVMRQKLLKDLGILKAK